MVSEAYKQMTLETNVYEEDQLEGVVESLFMMEDAQLRNCLESLKEPVRDLLDHFAKESIEKSLKEVTTNARMPRLAKG